MLDFFSFRTINDNSIESDDITFYSSVSFSLPHQIKINPIAVGEFIGKISMENKVVGEFLLVTNFAAGEFLEYWMVYIEY